MTLVVGMLVGVDTLDVKADATINNCAPANGQTVNLLSDNVYNFCANYSKGCVNTWYKKNSDKYYPTPASLSWDSVSGATSYTVEVSTNADLSGARLYGTSTNSIEIEDLYAGYDYYYRVSTSVNGTSYFSPINHFVTAKLPRTCQVDHAYNTRDIGGCYVNNNKQRVLQGKVYRGARLDEITDAGKTKMLNEYGIKTDLDLREASKVPSQPPLGDTVNLINISAPQYTGGPSSSNEVGGMDYSPAWSVVKREMEVFADANNYPIYVHCNIGRDRTGSILFLVEALLGMSEDEIYRDYELSFFAKVSNSTISDPTAFNVKNIDALATYIKNYSSGTLQQNTEKYLKESVGMSDAQLKQIKANLLTPYEEPTTVKPTTKPVKPAKVTLKSAKNVKKKSILVKYKKASNAKGYQVCWATSKKFKKAKTKNTTALKYKIKKLKKKKTYYVRVRAYNQANKTTVYGDYSKTKKVKVKK